MKACIWKHFPFLILLYILINFPILILSQPNFLYQYCEENGTNSQYKQNLVTVLSSLSSNTDEYGFYSSSFGEKPAKSYAMALCRSDFDIQTCRNCINYATIKLGQTCPNGTEAGGWYDECMVRYSNTSNNGTLEMEPIYLLWNTITAANVQQFSAALNNLLERLRVQAASGGSRRKFSIGDMNVSNSLTIYGLLQCTPDLSEENCSMCLIGAMDDIFQWNESMKRGIRSFVPSCYLRFETYKFYNESQIFNYTLDADAFPASPAKKNGNIPQTTIIVVASTVGFVLVLTFCICLFARKRKRRIQRQRAETNTSSCLDISNVESLQYDFHTISAATNDFSDANKLGQGGFGSVYKGKVPSGQEIAVKRLAQNSKQGDQEFKNEVTLVAKLSHRNLVKLLGFCLEGSERLLIYEFVPNSSLDQFIFNPVKRELLDWQQRYKIINGIAKGLLYLHEDSRLRIIHRDLKSSNVLLDDKFIPKIADFGLARLVVMDETQGITRKIVGTYGYMSPEYAMMGKFSVKSDVFSFGVLILEIMSGKRNNSFRNGKNVENLISYVWKNWCDGTTPNVIDPILMSSLGSTSEIMRCIHIGLLCVQENVAARPTMALVVFMLSSLSAEFPLPSEPAFLFGKHSLEIINDPSLVSKNEMSVTDVDPR